MKKFKILKILLPLIGIGLFTAAAVWLQGTGWIGHEEDSPEDALQAALGGKPEEALDKEALDKKAIYDAVLKAARELSEALQKLLAPATEVEAAGETVSMLSTKALPLRDLYAVPGQAARFHVYHPEAVNYIWEYYDIEAREWRPAAEDAGLERDALGRMAAYADFRTPEGQPELLIRCLYEMGDVGEQFSEMAFLKALPQEIRQLALAEESIAAEAGAYLAACDIAVEVTYADDTSDVIDGLYGLYFMETEEVETEAAEYDVSADGILTERKVQTILNHFCQYCLVHAGEKNITLAYMPDTESPRLQLPGTVAGTDEEPPVISRVDILTREDIPDTEGKTSVEILVTAEDNVTPYPRLQYAVIEDKEEGKDVSEKAVDIGEIAEKDWLDGPRVSMTLQGSRTWILCCRDQAGNVSVYRQGATPEEQPALAQGPEKPPDSERDTQAPVIRNIYVEAD